jgi:hypothetical protein
LFFSCSFINFRSIDLQYPKEEKPSTSKPSLLSTSDQAGADDVRILTSLPPGKLQGKPAITPMRKKARRRAGLLMSLLILIVAGIAGVLMLDKSATPAAPPASASASTSTAAPVQTPQLALASTQAPPPAPVAEAKSGEPPATAEHSDAAVITDENPTSADTDKQDRQDKLTSALEAGVKPPPAALQTALEAGPAPAAQKPAAHAKLVNKVDTHKAETNKAETRADTAKPDEHKKPSKATVVAKNKNDKNAGKDGDVDLISALVAHTADPSQKQNAKPKPPKLAQADKDAAKARLHERNEDIVERRAGESTESLLKRCSTLGFIEGELCRWRICSGRWDNDASCKANVK